MSEKEKKRRKKEEILGIRDAIVKIVEAEPKSPSQIVEGLEKQGIKNVYLSNITQDYLFPLAEDGFLDFKETVKNKITRRKYFAVNLNNQENERNKPSKTIKTKPRKFKFFGREATSEDCERMMDRLRQAYNLESEKERVKALISASRKELYHLEKETL